MRLMKLGSLVITAWVLFFGAHPAPAAPACEVIRAGIDVGSGTTKMTVARVDVCAGKVLEILAPLEDDSLDRPVPYKKSIEVVDGRAVFREEVIRKGIDVLKEMYRIALDHGAREVSVVATSAFRSVDPGFAWELQERIAVATGMGVRIISQDEEARLGFFGAVVKRGVPKDQVLVWDIGGGSMQISYWDPETGGLHTYKGHFASESIHKFIMEKIEGKDYETSLTPNPILPLEADRTRMNPLSIAIDHVYKTAMKDLPAEIRQFVARKKPEVIGIGGVHYYNNCELLGHFDVDGCDYSRAELRWQSYRYGHMTDRDLVTAGVSDSLDFAPFRITGALLTYGFMRALGVEKVHAVKVDMCDGVLIEPGYWPPRHP